MTRVSVLVPTYNGAAFLRQCLRSVLQQTVDDWTVVVGDDASVDETEAVVASFADPRIRFIRRPRNVGCYSNINLLLAEADSEYVAILNQDDWWEPTFLATMLALLDRSPSSVFATCASKNVVQAGVQSVSGLHEVWPPERGSTCPSAEAVRLLVMANWIRTPAVLARTDLYNRVSRFDEAITHSADWLMWLRAAATGPVQVSPEALANYRVHNMSRDADLSARNLYGIQAVLMARILATEWTGTREPFPGASRQIAATISGQLLTDAARRSRRGDRPGAQFQARLARAVAPSRRQASLALLAEKAIAWTPAPLADGLLRPLSTLGPGFGFLRRTWYRSA